MFSRLTFQAARSERSPWLNLKRFYRYQQRAVPQQLGGLFTENDEAKADSPNLYRLINAYRAHGHRVAKINPLDVGEIQIHVPELTLDRYHLDRSSDFSVNGLLHGTQLSSEATVDLSACVQFLEHTYTGNTGYEFMHVENEAEREWFAREIEKRSNDEFSPSEKCEIAFEMIKSQNFDNFLASKFPTLKRYGGEGCESVMAFYLQLFKSCADQAVDHLVIAMAHRGRLNFLTGPLQFPAVQVFRKIKGFPEFPPDAQATGDVLSHLFTSVDVQYNQKNLHVSLLPNPSHLEAINPVGAGKVRAIQQDLKDYDYTNSENQQVSSRAMCLQIHGDAALAGQGINQEILGFANVPHFRTGGSVHLVINNQVGFTTPQELARSSRYTTDIAKSIGAPVIHVNGDHPEEVAKAARLAVDYRQQFGKDIFVDLVCFRRWGHNELDDPTFTNPELYKVINNRQSVPNAYCDRLQNDGLLSDTTIATCIDDHTRTLNEHLKNVETYKPAKSYLNGKWSGLVQAGPEITTWDTGMDLNCLQYIGHKSVAYPENFNIHPHLEKTYVKNRKAKMLAGQALDWSTAETLAFGSLLYQDFGVRISGEDVGRGTFSHRHVMLVDQDSGEAFYPLNNLLPGQQRFIEVANSTLSEEAVLGFEYGYSIHNPNNLPVWEAQFGDFFNGAQIMIDTFLATGEAKWMLQSGLTMLLPHGMDGAGPEHSSCRIERFLQMTDSYESDHIDGDNINFQVLSPTTPAQYFHLLRRQMLRNYRKPAVVVGPKTLIRLSAATSPLADFDVGTYFRPVLGETAALDAKKVKTVMFVSGKLYYDLITKRDEHKAFDTAIIRLESLCPFPTLELEREIKKYSAATNFTWVQEEHQNQGAWSFVKPRFQNLLGLNLSYVGRKTSPVTAVGVGQVHKAEVEQLFATAFQK